MILYMKILLIPSAVLVSRDMRKKFGDLPTALFPLGDKTMVEHIYDKYKSQVDKIYIVVYKNKVLIEDYVAIKKLPIEIIVLDQLKDLGYTIFYGMNYILSHNVDMDYVYINFADSLLDDMLPITHDDVIYFSQNATFDEWTYFNEDNGRIRAILDKNQLENNLDKVKEYKNIFVGVFALKYVQKFLSIMKRNIDQSDEWMDSFYRTLLEYSVEYSFSMLETSSWFDVGHSDNYLKAKTNVEARAFNTIEIDEKRGILKKCSDNKVKLVDEIRWYLRLPNKLQYLLPRIYDYSLDLNSPYVSMEYYGYHTLHESLMYGNLPLVKWQDIFKKLLFAIQDMEKYKVEGTKDDFIGALNDIYLQKTFIRLDKMRNHPGFKTFFSNPIFINGIEYLSLNQYLAMLPNLIRNIVMDTFSGRFNIIHGDLCFANVLIEDTYNFVRFIDPRGKFGEYDIYGDGRYELAKLMHTLEGKYDFIIEDMFSIEVENNHIEYHLMKNVDNILNVFMGVFKEKMKDIQAIRLIEATLFLSMIPLHNDYETRQYAMLSTGIMLLDRVIKSSNLGNEEEIWKMS